MTWTQGNMVYDYSRNVEIRDVTLGLDEVEAVELVLEQSQAEQSSLAVETSAAYVVARFRLRNDRRTVSVTFSVEVQLSQYDPENVARKTASVEEWVIHSS